MHVLLGPHRQLRRILHYNARHYTRVTVFAEPLSLFVCLLFPETVALLRRSRNARQHELTDGTLNRNQLATISFGALNFAHVNSFHHETASGCNRQSI